MAIALGSWVRVVEWPELEAFLREGDPRDRPEPRQMLHAGRQARVVGVRLDLGPEPRYVLEGFPGFWREGWLRPL